MNEREAFDAYMCRMYKDEEARGMAYAMERETWNAAIEYVRSKSEPVAIVGELHPFTRNKALEKGAMVGSYLYMYPTTYDASDWRTIVADIAYNWLPNIRLTEYESSLAKTYHNRAVDECIKHVLNYNPLTPDYGNRKWKKTNI